MRIDVHHHDDPSVKSRLDYMIHQLGQLQNQGVIIMSQLSDALADLAAANEVTNEIAADVDELVARAAEATDPDEINEVKAQAAAIRKQLEAVAAKYTPPSGA